MASRNQENEKGKCHFIRQPDGERVSFHVVDGNEGLLQLADQPQAEGQAHAQAQGEAGHGGGGDGREFARRDSTGRQRLLHYPLDVFSVKLLSYWRNDPAGSERGF